MFDFQGANENQREAITSTEGPLLIIAGPGTGKTFTLVMRTFYLLRAHEGEAAQVGTGSGDTIAFETDRFSTYTLGSKDTQQKASATNTPTQNPSVQSSTTTTRASTPRTGDSTGSWAALLICALLGGSALALARGCR